MRAYELGTDANHFQAYLVANTADHERIREACGQPQAGPWHPVKLVEDRETKRRDPRGDFPCIFTGFMVAFSQRAVDALRDLLEPAGDLLPVECAVERLWLFNCTHVADVLDEASSQLRRYDTGRVAHIYKHAWRPEVEGESIFRVPQFRRSPTYVTDTVVERFRSAGLVGYRLIE